ncbi:hypothetical protein D3C86_1292020 [compost metagenome]
MTIRIVEGKPVIPCGAQWRHAVRVERQQLAHLAIPAANDPSIGIATQQDAGLHPLAELQRALKLVRRVVQHGIQRMIACAPPVVAILALVQDERQRCDCLRDGRYTRIHGAHALGAGRVQAAPAQGCEVLPIVVPVAALLVTEAGQNAVHQLHTVSSHSLRGQYVSSHWRIPAWRSTDRRATVVSR